MPKLPGGSKFNLQCSGQSDGRGFVRWSELEEVVSQLREEIAEEKRLAEKKIEAVLESVKGSEKALGQSTEQKSIRVSYNELREKENAPMAAKGKSVFEQSMAVDVTERQGALDSDDVTVDSWSFRSTCWDAVAFVGDSSMMLMPEAITTLIMLCASFLVQGLFVTIVLLSLSSGPIEEEDITGFRLWRTNVGHDVRYVNELTGESLTSRVCREDSALHLSDRQVQTLIDIRDYKDINTPFNGPMMCLLAMFAWILTVNREFKVMRDMWTALLGVPRKSETVLELIPGRIKPMLKVSAFGRLRLCWLALLTVLRLCVGMALLMAGLIFLATTHSIEDILLNAVALEFVLNVDELMFQALAPVKTRKMLLIMYPMPCRKTWVWKGVDIDVAWTTIFSLAILSVLFVWKLLPEIDIMEDAETEICGGLKDFAYGASTFGMYLYKAEQASVQQRVDELYTTAKYRNIRELIKFKSAEDAIANAPIHIKQHEAPALFGNAFTVQGTSGGQTNPDWDGYWNGRCMDLITPSTTPASSGAYWQQLQTLRDAVLDQSVHDCSKLTRYCNKYTAPGPAVRLICAQSCGCDKQGSALVLRGVINGCPASCPGVAQYKAQLANRQCTQPPKAVLLADPTMAEFMKNWIYVSATFGDNGGPYYQMLIGLVQQMGCDIVAAPELGAQTLCTPSPIIKSLAYWCPIFCGCNLTSRTPECPTNCAIGEPMFYGPQNPSDA